MPSTSDRVNPVISSNAALMYSMFPWTVGDQHGVGRVLDDFERSWWRSSWCFTAVMSRNVTTPPRVRPLLSAIGRLLTLI